LSKKESNDSFFIEPKDCLLYNDICIYKEAHENAKQ